MPPAQPQGFAGKIRPPPGGLRRTRSANFKVRPCRRDCGERQTQAMTTNGKGQELKIRRAKSADAPRLAELATELGYRSTSAELRQRLRWISPASQNAVFVAEAKHAGVVGWLHV